MTVFANRVAETTTSTGTGDKVLDGAVSALFQPFSEELADGATVYYEMDAGAEYEVGEGTYNAGANSITPTTVYDSSNGDAAVDWGSGQKTIRLTVAADWFTQLETIRMTAVVVGDNVSDLVNDAGYLTSVSESDVTQHEAAINHDALTNFVANEHIDWTSASANLSTSGSVTATSLVDSSITGGTPLAHFNSSGDLVNVAGSSVSGSDVTVGGEVILADSTLRVKRLQGNDMITLSQSGDAHFRNRAASSKVSFVLHGSGDDNNRNIHIEQHGTQSTAQVGGITLASGSAVYTDGAANYPLVIGTRTSGNVYLIRGDTPLITLSSRVYITGAVANTKEHVQEDIGTQPTPGNNQAGHYAYDSGGGTTHFWGFDEAGNDVQLTPHAKDAPAGLYLLTPGIEPVAGHFNRYRGDVRWVNLETGIALTETFDEYNSRLGLSAGDRGYREVQSWTANQDRLEAEQVKRQQEWDEAESAKEQAALDAQAEWDARRSAAIDKLRKESAEWRALPSFLRQKRTPPKLEDIGNRPETYERDLAERPPDYTRKAAPAEIA